MRDDIVDGIPEIALTGQYLAHLDVLDDLVDKGKPLPVGFLYGCLVR